MSSSKTAAAVLAVALLSAGHGAAQAPIRVARMAWLTGCWQLSSDDRIVEEHWLMPRAGTMIGIGRTVQGGKLLEYETVLLREQDGRLAYEAHPSGRPEAVFLSTLVTERTAIFENPQHDFPQRVGYERTGVALRAWLEGAASGVPRRIEFAYTRVPCDAMADVRS